MKIRILESATKDLKEGFYFYESQQAGLGTYFIETLFSDIDSLQLFAGIHSVHFEKYYRLLSKRFPFAVYYRVVENEIRIYSIFDCRRNPAWIKNKLN